MTFPRTFSGLILPDISDIAIPTPDMFDDDKPISRDSLPSPISLPLRNTDDVTRITPEDAAEVIVNPASKGFDKCLVLDCRFPYEFKGGHIKNAINVLDVHSLRRIYHDYQGQNVCIIFHCEFSKNRSKNFFQDFRDYDRRQHVADYPNISYPNAFLLAGGYKHFYQSYEELCVGGYIEMRDTRFVSSGDLRKFHTEYNKNFTSRFLPRPRSHNSMLTMPLSSSEISELVDSRTSHQQRHSFPIGL